MIYVFCPLHAEALPLIQALHLSKQDGPASFTCYGDKEKWFLTVCGTGKTACATAVGAVLAVYGVTHNDIVVLYGSAGGVMNTGIGQLYNGVKILDYSNGQEGYPDVLTKDSPTAAMIISGDAVYDGGMSIDYETNAFTFPILYDMESSAFFKAAMMFCDAHQIAVLRYVSDNGYGIIKEALKQFSLESSKEALSYMERMNERINVEETKDYTADAQWLNGMVRGTVTMKNQCRQIITWCELSEVDWKKEVQRMMEEGKLPCKEKEEGKKVLHEFKKRICG